ncbi:MAG: S9 family peptidase [Holophagaceae bacterium]
MRLAAALCLPCLSLALAAQDWTPAMQMKVRPVSDVQPAPDGRRAAFVVREAVMTPERSEFVSQIWLGDASGARPLTRGEKSSSAPRWSPDGRTLAFLSSRSGKGQLYALPLDGGEAEVLTEVKGDLAAFAWSPDGKSIAFTMLDAKTEAEEKAAKGKDDARWAFEKPAQRRLYVVALAPGGDGKREVRQLTQEDRTVNEFDWSPDSRSIVYSHVRSPLANDWVTADLAVVEVASGTVRTLAATRAAETNPAYSLDGTRIAFQESSNPPTWVFRGHLAVVGASGGAPKALPETPDARPDLIGWTADGKLLFSESSGTRAQLATQTPATGAIVNLPLPLPLATSVSLNASGRALGLTLQAPDQPVEAFLLDLAAPKAVKVSSVNQALATLPAPRTEVIRWTGAKGQAIEGLLTYPLGYAAGSKVPLILNVHGGPAGAFTQAFVGNPGAYPIAAFAAKGIAVLRPNPRGSTGYGFAFRNGNLADWGGADYEDLMKGVDKVIALGVADPGRLGVMGWSYGGFMTSWIITQTHRFRAASIGAAVTNLESFNGTSDIPDFIPDYFGGQAWEKPEAYRTHGSMTAVRNARTPSLIQHNEGDLRVPISQGYELFNALRHLGVESRMLVFPRQAHGPTEPKATLKTMQTNLDWFVGKLLK